MLEPKTTTLHAVMTEMVRLLAVERFGLPKSVAEEEYIAYRPMWSMWHDELKAKSLADLGRLAGEVFEKAAVGLEEDIKAMGWDIPEYWVRVMPFEDGSTRGMAGQLSALVCCRARAKKESPDVPS